MKKGVLFCIVLIVLGAAGWAASGVALGKGLVLLDTTDSTSTDTTSTDTTTTDTTTTGSTTTDTTPTTSTDTTTTTTTTAPPPPPDNPPTVQGLPLTMSAEANGPGGSVVTYPPLTAQDDHDGSRPVTCSPPSGSLFHLGATPVNCSASDTTGHTGTASSTVTVRDTTPPTLVVPAPHTIYATSDQGVSDSDAAVVSFLHAASATDIVDPNPTVGSDIHAFVPIGQTVIKFFARDASGNAVSRDVLLTVLPKPPAGTPPLPPPVVAHVPGNVAKLAATQRDNAIALSWQLPTGCDHVVVSRSAPDGSGEKVVYTGKATTLTDKGLLNGVEYRYVIRCFDAAGNGAAGVAIMATPMQNRLRAPKDGARLRKPPKLAWAREPDADYYNVQLLRNGTRILAVWPVKATFTLKKTWKFKGRKYTLKAGTYQWYVWPGYGNRKNADYGVLLGFRTFSIRP
jgi:hypothetical protein